MTITAEEARKLTGESLKGPAIQHFIDILDQRIKDAATEGKSQIYPHLLGKYRMPFPSTAQWEAIARHYIKLGFTWRNYPDPDPGNPVSNSYTILSW